jgi:amino acid permease
MNFLDLFRNFALNIRATGPAAILVVWIIAVATLGLYGQGEIASSALKTLSTVGGALVIVLLFSKPS